MKNTPVDYQTARKVIESYELPDFGKATIREVVATFLIIMIHRVSRLGPH